MNTQIHDECTLVANHTGDGWELCVEDKGGDVIAFLKWPRSWPNEVDTAFLKEAGFEIA